MSATDLLILEEIFLDFSLEIFQEKTKFDKSFTLKRQEIQNEFFKKLNKIKIALTCRQALFEKSQSKVALILTKPAY